MPTRYLKPGIRDSETIDKLSPMAEILYYRLLVTVDDFGRYDARLSMIKSQCFPVKDSVTAKDCQKLLAELSAHGLLVLYAANGSNYLQMLKWDNKPRASTSMFPACADECIQVHTDADAVHTVLPVTVTVTKTETAPPDGVSDVVWRDFLKHRKAKKAVVTETAMHQIEAEAAKAGWSIEDALKECCSRGWTGFKADWVQQNKQPGGMPPGAI